MIYWLTSQLQFNILVDQYYIFFDQLQFDLLVDQYDIFFNQLQFNMLVERMMFELLPARKDSIQTFQIQTRLPLTTQLYNKTSNWVKRIHEVSKLG